MVVFVLIEKDFLFLTRGQYGQSLNSRHLVTHQPCPHGIYHLGHYVNSGARYAREQILVGFGVSTFEKQANSREGVFSIREQNIELLFVTLNKNEKQFSPTTMYHDYAINEQLFHWQSQNSARPDYGRGLDYVTHKAKGKRLFLFVREQAKDEFGKTIGFVNFGEVDYVSHIGRQPMNITWQLRNTMPTFMWKQAAKLAMA